MTWTEKGSFIWAITQMKKGKKVRHQSWHKSYYIIKDCNMIQTVDIENNTKERGMVDAWLKFSNFEDNGWEIYEEDDNWNWNTIITMADSILPEGKKLKLIAIHQLQKTLKEKILEDTKKLWTNGDFRLGTVDDIITKRFGF